MKLNIKTSHWIALALLSAGSAFLWIMLALPRYQVIDLTIDRGQAVHIAENFVTKTLKLPMDGYREVAVFSVDSNADRYLQNTLGPRDSKRFVDINHYDLFYWNVRFFKEGEKEEVRVVVSSKTGEVIHFSHVFEDTAVRSNITQNQAREYAIHFLNTYYPSVSLDHFDIQSEKVDRKENRVDYHFTWKVKDVSIPWDSRYGGGRAQLLMTLGVSGDEIFNFNKIQLSIPEGFSRYIDRLKQSGENLMMFSRLFFIALLAAAVMLLVNRKGFIVPQIIRRFYFILVGVVFVSAFFDTVNGMQHLIYSYPTADSYWNYLLKTFLSAVVNVFFAALMFVIPGLAGESLQYEVNKEDKKGSLLNPVLSSFFSRPVAQQIWLGYFFAPVLLAVQSVAFFFGVSNLGVWDEMTWLTQVSVSFVPALTAFAFAFQSSIGEEIMFRLFAINLFRRYGFGIKVAVVVSAIMWGLGHTGYEIFPMWFRGIEVTLLGIAFGIVYLRFGLITVITAHYLMDAFRYSLQFMINPKLSLDTISSFAVFFLPLALSLSAYLLNRSSQEKSIKQSFTPNQEYNYQLLRELSALKTAEERVAFKRELLDHGWDPVIINRIFSEEL